MKIVHYSNLIYCICVHVFYELARLRVSFAHKECLFHLLRSRANRLFKIFCDLNGNIGIAEKHRRQEIRSTIYRSLKEHHITGYGSTLYIGIAMVFVFPPYIWKFTSCFQFQVNLTFNDFTAQNVSKVICVPNISLNYHFWAKL